MFGSEGNLESESLKNSAFYFEILLCIPKVSIHSIEWFKGIAEEKTLRTDGRTDRQMDRTETCMPPVIKWRHNYNLVFLTQETCCGWMRDKGLGCLMA